MPSKTKPTSGSVAASADIPGSVVSNDVSLSSSSSASLASFVLPVIQDHPKGWGPHVIPSYLNEIPYAPYSKSDRLGKIADWTSPVMDANVSSISAVPGASSTTQPSASSAATPAGAANYPLSAIDGQQQQRTARRRMGAPEAFGSGLASAFAFSHSTADDEASFSVVDRMSTAGSVKKVGGSSFRYKFVCDMK